MVVAIEIKVKAKSKKKKQNFVFYREQTPRMMSINITSISILNIQSIRI